MPPPKFQGEWCRVTERPAGGGWEYRLCNNVPGGGTAKMVITGTTATMTDAKGVAACTAKADLPDPFVANWYVHYDCGGKPHTMRYARTDDGDRAGLRVQFITGPVHASFVNAERARKAVEEDYAAPKP